MMSVCSQLRRQTEMPICRIFVHTKQSRPRDHPHPESCQDVNGMDPKIEDEFLLTRTCWINYTAKLCRIIIIFSKQEGRNNLSISPTDLPGITIPSP